MCVHMFMCTYACSKVTGINTNVHIVCKYINKNLWSEFINNSTLKNMSSRLLEKSIRLTKSE